MAAPLFYTAEMVRQLNAREPRWWPRYETVHGELLVTPAPRYVWHQRAIVRLAFVLGVYLRRERVGEVLTSPADISFGGLSDVSVQPDLFVVPLAESREAEEWIDVHHLLLAVEVLSRRTARADRVVKRWLYQERGVPLYWVVDTKARTVGVWTPGATEARVERERLVWHPEGASTPFELSLEELFREP